MTPPYPLSRNDKKIMSGHFTERMTEGENTLKALKVLAENSARLTASIKRPSFDYRNGEEFETKDIKLHREDLLNLSKSTREELLRSRQVYLIVEFEDGGIAFIDLTGSSWTKVSPSEQLETCVLDFGRRLESGARAKFFTGGWATAFFFYPFSFILPLAILEFTFYYITDPEIRNYYDNKAADDPMYPDKPGALFYSLGEEATKLIVLYPWPFFILLAMLIMALHMFSGGINAWPRGFSSITLHRLAHYTWKKAIPEDTKLIRATTITVVVTAIATFYLSKIL